MFYSGISAQKIKESIEAETQINTEIPAELWCMWINMTEQLLYSDVICEMRYAELDFSDEVLFDELPFDDEFEDFPRFSDICGIFAVSGNGEKTELEESEPKSFFRGVQGEFSYLFDGGKIRISADGDFERLLILRYARPVPKRVISGLIIGEIMLPPEFCEMIVCRLRGEAFRLINDDVLCAKWIGEYNAHLENFKAFIDRRRAKV